LTLSSDADWEARMIKQKTSIRIGYCLSLTGPLAVNGQTARLAHQIWQERVNERGGLVGREVELVCVDDRTDASSVAGIYKALLAGSTSRSPTTGSSP
jgi:branched-chain amino acid transport system substrate-binding protein